MRMYERLNRAPKRRDVLSMGLVVAGVLGALGAFSAAHARSDRALVLFGVGVVFLVLSWIPRVGRALYVAWMGLGLTIGFFTAPIVLLAVYALAVVPVALWFKITRRDAMRRRLNPAAKTYWEDYPRPNGVETYTRRY